MVTNILGARVLLQVPFHRHLVRKHAQAMAKKRAAGLLVLPHTDLQPAVARVDHGRWVASCTCGGGLALEYGWPDARCLSCGAIRPVIVWPAEREDIEAVLALRPDTATRSWLPPESLQDLIAENRLHGLPVPGGG